MDFTNLLVFIRVSELGSFSAAAESLYLTQPAVSKRIAQLEDELGARLFDRIGRQIALTETGEIVLPRARELINDAQELKRVVRDLSGDVGGRLTMATSHHVGLHRLPPILRLFTHAYPKVELDIRFMDSEAACRSVETGDIELAVVTLPPEPLPNLTLRRLWRDPLVFTVAADHPLAVGGKKSVREIVQFPAVLPSPGTYTRAILEQAVDSRALNLSVSMETNYLETLQMLVASGLGWSLLPRTLVDDRVIELQVPDMQLERQLGAVTHQKRTLSRAAQGLIDLSENQARQTTEIS